VLVNGQSASASEIVSGALSENGRAIVVGERTFGKGSVQSLRTFGRDGMAQLKFTTARYYLPSGRSLHRTAGSAEWGVDPTPGFYASPTRDQLIEMVRVRRDLEVLREGEDAEPIDWTETDAVLERLHDPQLTVAVEAIEGMIETGEWKATGGEAPSGESLAGEELVAYQQRRERLVQELERVDDRIDDLVKVASSGEAEDDEPLLAADAELTGGRMIVYDAGGNVVGELEITGEDVERWLEAADVAPARGAEAESSDASEGGE